MDKLTRRRHYRQPSLWVCLLLLAILVAYQLWQLWQSPPKTTSAPNGHEFPATLAGMPPICTNPPAPVTSCPEQPPKKLPQYNACFGHLPYAETPARELASVGRETMRSPAALKFRAMRNAARNAGARMYDISGFRDISTQNFLFYEIAQQRGQTLAERARVSAPPGFSEHHTGYAIDIGDADDPSTELRESFENTRVFAWLRQNAASFQFELSFPRGNRQRIAYEPWHWRFVGDSSSQSVFAIAQQCLNIKS